MAFNIYFDSLRPNNNSKDEYIIANSFAEFKQQVYKQQCFPIAVSINSDLKEHSIQIVEWLVRWMLSIRFRMKTSAFQKALN